MNIHNITLSEDSAKLLLRVLIGVLVLLHGIAKVMEPESLGFIGSMLSGLGLPAFIAYGVYIGEIVAPIMLIVGYKTKLASALIAFTLLVAILLAHTGDIFALNEFGGWGIELQALYLFGAIVIFGLGNGRYAIEKD